MPATVTPLLRGSRFRVTCADHDLDRTVDTEAHAENLRALHQRLDHPGERPAPDEEAPDGIVDLDLRRAAISVVLAADTTDLPFHYGTGVMLLWERLTGLEGTAALTLARQLADSPTPVTAHVAPF